jgi:hypothetical protein
MRWDKQKTSVDNLHIVEIRNGFQCFLDDKDGVALSEPSLITDTLKELTPCCQLGDDVKVLCALEPFIEFDNVGMVESLEEIHFVVDHMFVTLYILLCNDFDGHRAFGTLSLLDYAIPISD